MNTILIDNGKKPNDFLMINLVPPIPSDSPYGNLSLKFIKIIERLDEANRRIIDSYDLWEKIHKYNKNPDKNPYLNAVEMHLFAIEQAIYLIRRACDEIISLIWCLNYWETHSRNYPPKILCDCIGAVLKLKKNNKQILTPFKENLETLELINEISNAFKHSFINSDINLVGKDEPVVNALALDYNNLSFEPKFYSVELESIILRFNKFYKDSIQWLKRF